jgi:hypothetical protein
MKMMCPSRCKRADQRVSQDAICIAAVELVLLERMPLMNYVGGYSWAILPPYSSPAIYVTVPHSSGYMLRYQKQIVLQREQVRYTSSMLVPKQCMRLDRIQGPNMKL